MTASWRGTRIYTIGHSTRTLEQLRAALEAFGVSVLVDIRTIPRSRHNPQFNAEALEASLRSGELRYVHVPELGGLRRPRKDSGNTAWRNKSFQGFADYMLTPEFEVGLLKLHDWSSQGRVAMMCAEAVHWRCHRSLIADALTARGATVEHIASAQRSAPHHIPAFARVEGERVTYPGARDLPLATAAPFDLEATVRVLQRRPSNLVDVWQPDCYRRVLPTGAGLALVEVMNRGTVEEPDVRFSILSDAASAATPAELAAALRRVLGLDVDPQPLLRRMRAERSLRRLARPLRGMRPPRFPSLFEAFASVVPFQQVSLDAGVAILRRIVERFGEVVTHEAQRYYAFPRAEALAAARLDALRRCGLSRTKADAVRRIARAIEAGELSEPELTSLPSPDAIRRLIELPGIGPWSAALVLLRGFGRLDVFPPADAGIARALPKLLDPAQATTVDALLERFGEYRGYLYFCALGATLAARP